MKALISGNYQLITRIQILKTNKETENRLAEHVRTAKKDYLQQERANLSYKLTTNRNIPNALKHVREQQLNPLKVHINLAHTQHLYWSSELFKVFV